MKKTLSSNLFFLVFVLLFANGSPADETDPLAASFARPPDTARPWVYWFWINGNVTREGITADLEAMRGVGIGGVLWMEVSGQWWAPDGEVEPASDAWHDCFQWAIRECERLGLEFDVTLDFGYGSGGPHITPDLSMQRLYWSETEIEGGKPVEAVLARPVIKKNVSAWLRPGKEIGPQVMEAIERIDSYRDVATLAVPLASSPAARKYRIRDLGKWSGEKSIRAVPWDLGEEPPPGAEIPPAEVVDLTGQMDQDGRLTWAAPPGKWSVIRLGHASNFKMTRPCPQAAVGLECDRLSRAGIDAHFNAFLKPIITNAGAAAGSALAFAHIDSWEAGGQNWTATFPEEFRARRGYDIRPWLPVLTGRVVGDAERTARFLWDMRATAGELVRDNYAARLRDLVRPHGMKLSIEAYGHLCIDNLSYAGVADMPVSEFWARGEDRFPDLLAGRGGYAPSSKAMASAAHTYGRPVVGAEAFTSDRGWRDHPYLLKGMGDWAFCQGVNRMIFHLYAHQPYENAVPGLTHRKWGQHIQRHNTWWDFSRPWMEYLARCQHLLQQGNFVADVVWCFGEGAPLAVDDMELVLPEGYDYDLCSAEIALQLEVRDGRLTLPSGASYRYLLLPQADRMTLTLARKVEELVKAGARVIAGPRPRGTPGLSGYPRDDAELEKIAAALWDTGRVVTGMSFAEAFAKDGLAPDFTGEGLRYHHRRTGDAEIYFVANQEDAVREIVCSFRVTRGQPELWDPETGAIRDLPAFERKNGRTTVPLRFEPLQSWFVVFPQDRQSEPSCPAENGNFPQWQEGAPLAGPWRVAFDPQWGGPGKPVVFEELIDWSRHPDPAVRYYSGAAVYRTNFTLSEAEVSGGKGRLSLNLGAVEAMARVKLNGKECGIAWKPPYRIDISAAARAGENALEIEVVNLWINRMIGDEQLPLDGDWKDFETLLSWPEWFRSGTPRSSGRRTFTTCRHYGKETPLAPSGLLGPVKLEMQTRP